MRVFLSWVLCLLIMPGSIYSNDPVFEQVIHEIDLFNGLSDRFYNPSFGDIDQDGDIDIVFEDNFDYIFSPVLFINVGDSLFTKYQKDESILAFLDNRQFKSLRLWDYNDDHLVDIIVLRSAYSPVNNGYKTCLTGYQNMSSPNNIVWSQFGDTLLTVISPESISDVLLIDLIDDSAREMIIIKGDSINLYHPIQDSLVLIPEYFGIEVPNFQQAWIEPILNSAGEMERFILNTYRYYEPLGRRETYIATNTNTPENPDWFFNWQNNSEGEFLPIYNHSSTTNIPAVFQQLGSCETVQGTAPCFDPIYLLYLDTLSLISGTQNLDHTHVWMKGERTHFNDLLRYDWKKDEIEDIILTSSSRPLWDPSYFYFHIFQTITDINHHLNDSAYTFAPDFPANRYIHGGDSYFAGGDLDNDGDIDLLEINNHYFTEINIKYNSGNDSLPLWNNDVPVNLTIEYPSFPTLVDWDVDGDLDLILSENDSLFKYDNVGTQALPVFASSPQLLIGGTGGHSVFFDFDGDSDLDVIVGNQYFRNESVNPNIAFTAVDSVLPDYSAQSAIELIGLADGTPDLLILEKSGQLYFVKNQTVSSITGSTWEIPADELLYPNYPNPFNSSTTIRFAVSKTVKLRLTIYTITGEEISRLIDKTFTKGEYETTWNGIDDAGNQVASGVYFYRIQAAGYSATRKMLYIK